MDEFCLEDMVVLNSEGEDEDETQIEVSAGTEAIDGDFLNAKTSDYLIERKEGRFVPSRTV